MERKNKNMVMCMGGVVILRHPPTNNLLWHFTLTQLYNTFMASSPSKTELTHPKKQDNLKKSLPKSP